MFLSIFVNRLLDIYFWGAFLMKKLAFSAVILIILAAVLTLGLSVAVFADAEPSAEWVADDFGAVKWTAVSGASSYTLTLYEHIYSPTESDLYQIKAENIICSATSYNFVKEGHISEAGTYKFKVEATVDEAVTEITSEPKEILKLFAPTYAGWSVSSNNIVAEWTHNTANSVDAGYPALSDISYQLQLFRLNENNEETPISIWSISNGVTSKNMNSDLQRFGGGRFIFKVWATSEKYAFSSDVITVSADNALTYPIVITRPDETWFGQDLSDAGIAQWTSVSGASRYVVTFYKATPVRETVYIMPNGLLVDKDYSDPVSGETPEQGTMIVSYIYEKVGSPQTVNASSSTVENLQCDINTVQVKTDGVYFFSVEAYGQNNAVPSDPSGFLKTKVTGTTLYTAPVTQYYVDDDTRHDELIVNMAPYFSDEPVLFDFIKTDEIKMDLNNDGAVDDVQTNLSVFLPIGDSVTINAFRFTSTGDTPTPVPLQWNATQNASLVSRTTSGDRLTLTGLNEGVVTIKVTAKYSPYNGKELKVYVSHKPTKLTISGRNSFVVGDTPYQLQLAIEPSTASSDSKYFKWSSNNSTVVSVDEGRITPTATALATSPSYAIITCESLLSGVKAEYRVAVSNEGIKPARIDVVGNSTVPLKSSLQLTANVYSDLIASADSVFVTNPVVAWTTSNDKVATVDQNGKVTPKAIGKCTITATSKEAGCSHVSGSLEIEVVPEEINITKLALSGNKTVTVGESISIKLSITPTNATDRDIVWKCTGGGELEYKSELERTLTGTYEGTVTVSVYAANAPSIKSELVISVKSASDAPETDIGKTEIITKIKPTAGTGDNKNDYTADVKAEVLDEAISKVFNEAINLKTIPVIRIKVETPSSAESISVKVPYASLPKIFDRTGYKNKGILVVETGIGTMSIPSYALRSIYEQSNKNSPVQFKMVKVVNTDLNEEQQKVVGNDKVYEYLIISGGSEITSFGGYDITINIPFSLSSTQSGKGAQVNYLNDKGYLTPESTSYDYKTKTVYFDTTHLSYYIPYYYAAEAWVNPYIDVKRSDWFYDSVFYVVDRGLMNGISSDHFVPASYTTRAMVVTILHRLQGSPEPKGENSFVDVKDEQWYTDAVLWATEEGLVNGYGGGRFGPNDQVTREQIGVMLHNYAKYVDITPKYGWDTPMRYPDSASIASWARQGAMYCQITGIISGRSGGYFDPKGVATRAELATMLLRMNDQMQEELANR